MNPILRRLRGIIGTGFTWAVGWAGVFGVLSVIFGNPLGGFLEAVFGGSFLGFISGASFAAILSIVERRRTLDQLSLGRVALWGFIGGTTLFFFLAPRLIGSELPLRILMTSYMIPLGLNGLLGAGFASGSVALARQSDTRFVEGEDPTLRLGGNP